MTDPRVDQLQGNPFFQALMAGGLAVALNPNGARTDKPAGPAVNFYESGSTIVMQIFSVAGNAWRTVSLT